MDFEIDAIAILATSHPNVLLVGSDGAVDRSLEAVSQFLRLPVLTWIPTENQPLPDGSCGTLIVRAIDTANAIQQTELLAWLDDRAGTVQLVSTTNADLLSMIATGAFLETLYYYANQVTFPVQDTPHSH